MTKRSSYFFLLASLLLLSACVSSGPFGRWQPNREAQQQFLSGEVLPGHTYYYYGSSAEPEAVIAINNSFTLRTEVWIKVDNPEDRIPTWLSWYSTDYSFRCPYQGGTIITPDQQIAGIWYSKKTVNSIKTPEPGIIEVYLPFAPGYSACKKEEILDDR